MEFDYYIFIDYSENLIGYCIVEKEKIPELLKKIIKFRHFKNLRHKRTYLIKIKKIIKKEEIKSWILKQKISYVQDTLVIFNEILEFIKSNKESEVFISIDNKQHASFVRLFKELFSQKNIIIISENKLRKNSSEYRLSLVIDNMLNIERLSKKSK